MEKGRPWYLTARRWGQTNLTEDDPAKCDLEFWKRQWKRTKIQGVIINAGGIVAYYPSEFPLQYRAASLNGQDYFGSWNTAAREAGLAVIARMDINRATKDFYDAHPDWFCLDQNGEPIISQGRYFSCVNSKYYTEYIPAVLREIIERYHPDGFSDNSWKGMGRNQICYCENCKTKFKRDTGLELPKAVDWNDSAYGEWIRWSYQSRTDNWDLFNKVTQEAGGEDCLWLGMLHADPANLSGGFGDLKALCSRSKIIFSDHQSRETISGFEQNSANGNLLRLAAEENVAAPESMANYVRGTRTFRLASNPYAETRMWSVDGVAGGISPWYHHIGGSQNDARQFETPVELFCWHADNEDDLYNRENMANIGIVWNQENADFYGRSDAKERVAYPWYGTCRAMTRAKIPFLPVHASDVSRYADRIKVLVFPDIAVLSEAEEDAACRFLKDGGSIVLSGITGTLNHNGNSKPSSKLMDALGIQFSGENFGVFGETSESWENDAAHTYLRLPETRHDVLAGFEGTEMIAFGGGLRGVKTDGGLKQICSYIPPFPIYPPEFSWIREERPDLGTVFAGETRYGGRAVYFAADIDRCYGRTMLPDHAKLLENAVRWAASGDLPLSVEGTGYLDCCLYRRQGRTVLHMVNLSGCNQYPGYCAEVYPVGPLTVSVKVEGNPQSADLRVSGGDVPVRMDNGRAVFVIDKLTDHEMIVIE